MIIGVLIVIVILVLYIRKNKKENNIKNVSDVPGQTNHPQNRMKFTYTGEPITKRNAKILAPQYLKTVEESMHLINATKEPKVFFGRLELLLYKVCGLIEIEKYVKFSGQRPTQILEQIESKYTDTINEFIDRFYGETTRKINELKTDKAKKERVKKFYNELNPYFSLMDEANISKINDYLSFLQSSLNCTEEFSAHLPTGSFKDYWETLTDDELNCFLEYYPKYIGTPFEMSFVLSYDDISSFTQCIMVYYTMKKYDYCKRVLNYVEDHNISSRDVAIIHFFYLYAVKFLYQPTKPENDSEKAKEYCYKDIDLVLNNLETIKNIGGDGELPNIPTIKTLAIILEKEKNYEEAIRICDIAIKLGLDDKTQGGYIGRKEKLLKKQSS